MQAGNQYIDTQEPWVLRKTDLNRCGTVLWVEMEFLRCLSIVFQPVMPGSCEKVLDQLGVAKDERTFVFVDKNKSLAAGGEISKPQGVFPRMEE